MRLTTIAISVGQPLISYSLQSILLSQGGFDIVNKPTNENGESSLLQYAAADVLVTDFSAAKKDNDVDGFEKLRCLNQQLPDTRVLLLVLQEHAGLLSLFVKCGVRGVISSGDDAEEVVRACRHTQFTDSVYISPKIAAAVDKSEKTGVGLNLLSGRELDVIRQFSAGLSLRDIADNHKRSISTISSQKHVAMQKLGMTSNTELIRFAYTNGLI
ncbi:LuxR C-terminal-related transcriptional regulator [Enterobacter asburiae]